MIVIGALVCLVLLVANYLKFALWSGHLPPCNGWSERQMRRMERGKSPWTWVCWITHATERRREIDAVVREFNGRK